MPIDFELTEDQKAILKTVEEWCEENLPLSKIREFDEKREIPLEIIKGMGELGVLLPCVPKEHGGLGLDWRTACLIAEKFGYYDITIAIPAGFLVIEGAWGFTLDRYCSEKIRREYIQPAIKGERFIGIATTEAKGGSDISALETSAKKVNGKWVINGEKSFISGTEECKKMGGGYWILARTSPPPPGKPHLGMTAFFLPIDTPGVEIGKRYEETGRMALSCGSFRMTNVELSDEYRVGEEGKGFYYTMEGFDNARLLISASAVGVTQRVLELGIDYIKRRTAFGMPIGKYQGIQFELTDLWAEMEAVRAKVYHAAWMNDMKYQKNMFTPLEVCKHISACKLMAPHLALKACEKVMIWMGAYGYTKEAYVEMGWRGVMSYCIGAEGATNIQRVIIGRELLGREFVAYK